jgi:hypothetical protein
VAVGIAVAVVFFSIGVADGGVVESSVLLGVHAAARIRLVNMGMRYLQFLIISYPQESTIHASSPVRPP